MFSKYIYTTLAFLFIVSIAMATKVMHVEYYANGQKKLELTKVKHGLVRMDQYYSDGVLRETGFLKHGKCHGKWVSYNRIGQEVAVAYFYEDMRLGSWHFYDQWTGKSLNVFHQQGTPSSYRSYNRQGDLISYGSLK